MATQPIALTPCTAELVAESVEQLLVFPEIANAIIDRLEDDTTSSVEIGELVRQDIALTTALLRLSNSAQYYQGGKAVDDINSALSLVGLRQLKDLVYGICIPRATASMKNDVVELTDFWAHSLYTASFAYTIATSLRRVSEQTSFTAGLLHDIGQLALFYQFPEESRLAAEECVLSDCEMIEVEMSHFGFTHEDVGLALGRQWSLPESLLQCISSHHYIDPDLEYSDMVVVVHIANQLADAIETGECPIDRISKISEDLTSRVLPDGLSYEELIDNAKEHYERMRSSILPETKHE